MRINNNIAAVNTHRQYTINNNNIAKSTEKLSSGYRINRAGDDAAGLAISEKMRAQIRGLDMASKNSQDAISLVQTAEGALQETHNILQRMRELSVQAASDTNDNEVDRVALNAEFQQLINEIDDTANKTKFNGMGVINGQFAKEATVAAISNTKNLKFVAGSLEAKTGYSITKGLAADGAEYEDKLIIKSGSDVVATAHFNVPDGGYKTGDRVNITFDDGSILRFDVYNDFLNVPEVPESSPGAGDGVPAKVAADDLKAAIETAVAGFDITGKELIIQSGSNKGDELAININKMDAATLGIDTQNLLSQTSASKAIQAVNDAINQNSTQRSMLGALQNRLEHKIANLDTSSENLQAAESRIRDVDMAKEMTNYTKQNILSQAATAMLAQANSQPQGVLQLLR